MAWQSVSRFHQATIPHKKSLPQVWKWFSGLALILGIVCFTWNTPWRPIPPIAPVPSTGSTAAPEVRGVWLTNVGSGVFFLPWGTERALHQLSQLQFNTVYPVVWNRGHTFYPSTVARRVVGRSSDPFLAMLHPGQDVLKKLVEQGKKQHLRVIPWFEYGFIAPLNSSLAQQHPEWLTRQRNGDLSMKSLATEGMPATNGWLNPFHPQVQQFILDLIIEVVTRYEVAGIQLDDHFGLPVQFGYDFYTLQLYRQEHQGQDPPADASNPDWIRWRADKLTAFMQRIFQTVKAVKPDCLITLSPNSQGFSYNHYLQDWQTWVEQGWVEELVLQVYRNELTQFQKELHQPAVQAARQHIPVAIGIHTGTARQPTPFQKIQQQVTTARSQGFAGVSFFYWESLWGYLTPESPQQRRSYFQQLFKS